MKTPVNHQYKYKPGQFVLLKRLGPAPEAYLRISQARLMIFEDGQVLVDYHCRPFTRAGQWGECAFYSEAAIDKAITELPALQGWGGDKP